LSDSVFTVQGVSKKFCKTLKASMFHGLVDVSSQLIGLRQRRDSLRRGEFWAVEDVSFELKPGETLGLLGPNGSGKTTLLRLLSGIYPPDRGRIEIRGRLGALIAVGAGFHPLMTGRENIYLNGSILGLSRREIEAKFDDIVAFAEIDDFLDAPIKTYSSGMHARLGFAVAIHAHPEILLVDEVLSVGDFAFQKKCVTYLTQAIREGASMILVSHNPYLIERLADRVAIMWGGKMQSLGKPIDLIPVYFERVMNRAGQVGQPSLSPAEQRPGTGDVRVTRVEVLGPGGEARTEIFTGEDMRVRIHYQAQADVSGANLSVFLSDRQATIVVAAEATALRKQLRFSGQGYVDCLFRSLPLLPGVYAIEVRVAGDALIDDVVDAARFSVQADHTRLLSCGGKGIAYVEVEWIKCPTETGAR
jgi:lipopolysaccharide transport system ATP-binding protein